MIDDTQTARGVPPAKERAKSLPLARASAIILQTRVPLRVNKRPPPHQESPSVMRATAARCVP